MRLRILGCGASMGVPVVGCGCEVCSSPDPRCRRTRTSALLKNRATVLIDCSPDFRLQAIKARLSFLDALLITHAHHDHCGGLDDLRGLEVGRKHPIPLFCHEETLKSIVQRFGYLMRPNSWRAALLEPITVTGSEGAAEVGGEAFRWIYYEQQGTAVLGYRFGKLAYLTDIHELPKAIYTFLNDVDTLVVSAVQMRPHPYFLNVQQAVEFAQRAGVRRAILTHMSHDINPRTIASLLPSNVALAYDGLELSVTDSAHRLSQ